MIGTVLAESLVQSVALSHLVKGYKRVSLLFLAAPESGKTTIATAANCQHVCRIAVISARSILKEMRDHPNTEFLLFNDLSTVRAMSHAAVTLLVSILNQLVQDEKGVIAFAGKDPEYITRPIGVIGCMPFETFIDHRARWKELGFVSRMIPFAYQYGDELIAEIKDAIDDGHHLTKARPVRTMPRATRPIAVTMNPTLTREVRRIADSRSKTLGQLGIRLLQSYHCLIRAHALLSGRSAVNKDDIAFLRAVDRHVSITKCEPLNGHYG